MLPYFYQADLQNQKGNFVLDEATSRHCTQVLRMQVGDALLLTNGAGLRCRAVITTASRKRTIVELNEMELLEAPNPKFGLAIAFTKNNSRNEWLLEKATELGISDIYPLLTQRGEKDKLKPERLNNILVSAMLQSQQVYLPTLHEAHKINDVLESASNIYKQRFIAHCETEKERQAYWENIAIGENTLILIGPEGDFSAAEIEQSINAGCKPVTFGTNRLRTETAGLYACTVFNAKNNG